jgi:Cu(I)/Ag(I) efflux system membrane fusion protein
MSNTEIAELEKKGLPQQYLYLPEGGKVWVYITIYEYEMALVKEAQAVQIETAAYPGEVFQGIVVSVAPIFDRTARTLKVRALIKDTENKLKPEMYVDAKIIYDLGEKLAVPEDAVMDSGTRKIVFIAEPNDYFESRDVKLGPKVQGYYEVLHGLTENQTVVTSGNFLVDSESKLNAVLTQNQ